MASVAVLWSFGYTYCDACVEAECYLFLLGGKETRLTNEDAFIMYKIKCGSSSDSVEESGMKIVDDSKVMVHTCQQTFDDLVDSMKEWWKKNVRELDNDSAAFVIPTESSGEFMKNYSDEVKKAKIRNSGWKQESS